MRLKILDTVFEYQHLLARHTRMGIELNPKDHQRMVSLRRALERKRPDGTRRRTSAIRGTAESTVHRPRDDLPMASCTTWVQPAWSSPPQPKPPFTPERSCKCTTMREAASSTFQRGSSGARKATPTSTASPLTECRLSSSTCLRGAHSQQRRSSAPKDSRICSPSEVNSLARSGELPSPAL